MEARERMKRDVRALALVEEEERQFLLHILAFFAVSDSVVMDNLVQNFCQDAPCLEATFFCQQEEVSR